MPAVTPADVQTLPERTKIGSGSTAVRGEPRGELVARGPVRGRAALVEQAGRAEHEGSGADGDDPAGAPGDAAHRAHEGCVLARAPGALAPGDEQRVDRTADPLDRAVGLDAEPAGGAEGSTARARDDDLVRGVARRVAGGHAAGRVEDVHRPDQVERGDAVVADADDPPLRHASTLASDGDGRNDLLRSDSAIPAMASTVAARARGRDVDSDELQPSARAPPGGGDHAAEQRLDVVSTANGGWRSRCGPTPTGLGARAPARRARTRRADSR